MAQKLSKSKEAYFARYQQTGKYASNRRRKLEKLLKEQPNNLQIPLAIKNITSYRRKDPKEAYWSHQMIETAKLYKLFVGVFNRGIFSQKTEDQEAARHVRNPNLFQPSKKSTEQTKRISDYSLRARAHDSKGNLLWV